MFLMEHQEQCIALVAYSTSRDVCCSMPVFSSSWLLSFFSTDESWVIRLAFVNWMISSRSFSICSKSGFCSSVATCKAAFICLSYTNRVYVSDHDISYYWNTSYSVPETRAFPTLRLPVIRKVLGIPPFQISSNSVNFRYYYERIDQLK